VLIFLTFLHPLFKGRTEIYQGSLILTFIVSLFDGLGDAGVHITFIDNLFGSILPLYSIGLGWIVPAIVGGVIGYIVSLLVSKSYYKEETSN
jgi:LIVCS family branched-chain amino acid:cation transporter